MTSSCPICHVEFPLSELERHANSHFEEDELARDMELAHHIALAPPSPVLMQDTSVDFPVPSEVVSGWSSETSISDLPCNTSNNCERSDKEMSSIVASLQTKSTFYKVEGGIMSLLMRCLEMDNKSTSSIVTGYIDHFQSSISEDSGWGCGWRNIQMLSSHLLVQRQEAGKVMFGGSGFVPDIPSLQRWLEIAWERGFDIPGSKHFNQKVCGSKKWIGTTECAAVLRSFGLRARIVDFDSKSTESLIISAKDSDPRILVGKVNNAGRKGKMKTKQVYGPMDKFLSGRIHVGHVPKNESRSADQGSSSLSTDHNILLDSDMDKCSEETDGYQVLVKWIWNYFADKVSGASAAFQHVLVTDKTPLYFQHDGHSRTIVGIQVQKGMRGMQDRYTLLILDPGQRTAELERSLTENYGWQKLIKRGVHTLRKPQYQICYVDPGIAHGLELDQLKTIDSILIRI